MLQISEHWSHNFIWTFSNSILLNMGCVSGSILSQMPNFDHGHLCTKIIFIITMTISVHYFTMFTFYRKLQTFCCRLISHFPNLFQPWSNQTFSRCHEYSGNSFQYSLCLKYLNVQWCLTLWHSNINLYAVFHYGNNNKWEPKPLHFMRSS